MSTASCLSVSRYVQGNSLARLLLVVVVVSLLLLSLSNTVTGDRQIRSLNRGFVISYISLLLGQRIPFVVSRFSLNGGSLNRGSTVLNNYWMKLSMISWIVKTEVYVICWSPRLRQVIQTRGFDNSWYHAKRNSIILYYTLKYSKKRLNSNEVHSTLERF